MKLLFTSEAFTDRGVSMALELKRNRIPTLSLDFRSSRTR